MSRRRASVIFGAPHFQSSPSRSPAQDLPVITSTYIYSAELRSSQSVDLLNRQIKDARDNLLKSSSDGPSSIIKSFPSSHQPFESPPGSRVSLRRATTAFPERKEKKPLKTYGSRASQDDSRISSNDIHMQNHSSLPFTFGTGSFRENGARELIKEEVPNGVNGKPLAEDELGYSASSDVQNTGQQQGAHGASALSGSPTMRKKTSIIDDKILGLSNGNTMSSTSGETSALHVSVAITTLKNQDSSDDPVSLPTIPQNNSAQGDEIFISDTIDTKSKKRPRFSLDLLDPHKVDKMHARDYDNASPAKRARVGKTDKLNNHADQDDTCDELSLSLSKQQPSHTTSKNSKTKKLREKDELDDDKLGLGENDIGLPVEKYQPRPSRSRSGRQDDELIVPADFSKRPETTAKGKKKNKRRKTTAFEQLLHIDEDETDIVQIKIPSPVKDPEKKVRDVPTNNNFETIDFQPQPEIDPPRDEHPAAPPKKRGRPRKQVSEIREEPEKSACSESSPTKSVKHAELNKPTSKKRKAAALDLDSDHTSAEEEEGEEDHLPPRPSLPSEIKSDIPQKPPPSLQNHHSPVAVHIPLPIAAPTPVTRSPSPVENNTNTNTNKESSSAVQTPRKTTTTANKGPDKHSPINSGKVAYRVGLSKRARIEPLLRIVRK